MPSPVFLLAFAYNPVEALPGVVNELKLIQDLLSETDGRAETIWQPTPDHLERLFDTQRAALRLFHYSGHASPDGLQLNRNGEAARIAFSNSLAESASVVRNLSLVFLNGCSTQAQARIFLDQGAGAVISTTKPLLDRYGVDFARRFYRNFTRRNGQNTLQQAFNAAARSFNDEHGNLTRSMLDEQVRGSIDVDEQADEPLYEIHFHPDKKQVAEERFIDWFAESTGPAVPAASPSGSLKTKIQDLIAQGRLEDALNELVKVLPDAILLKGQYSSAKRENSLGLLDSDDWRRTIARLNNSVLEMARGLS